MPGKRSVLAKLAGSADFRDPDLFSAGLHHELFRRFRREQPIYWNPEADASGFWVVTKYDDVLRILEDPETFSAATANGGFRIFDADQAFDLPNSNLLSMDPPEHDDIRRCLAPAFSTRAIASRETAIRQRAADLIDAMAKAGTAEFVSSFAAPLTMGVLCDLLGTPERDAPKMLQWSNVFIGDDDPEFQPSEAHRVACSREFDSFAARLFALQPGRAGDLISILRSAEFRGKAIAVEDFTVHLALLLVAGNETTRNALSSAVLALSLFPAERRKLLDDPSLMGSAVDEVVRWSSPLMHVRRTAMRDVRIGEVEIHKGDKVVLWFVSANRDEEKWADSFEFKVSRFEDARCPPHLGFSAGPHHCLGRRLAELQIRVALEELLSRVPDIRAAEPPRVLRSNFISGIKSLRVCFDPVA